MPSIAIASHGVTNVAHGVGQRVTVAVRADRADSWGEQQHHIDHRLHIVRVSDIEHLDRRHLVRRDAVGAVVEKIDGLAAWRDREQPLRWNHWSACNKVPRGAIAVCILARKVDPQPGAPGDEARRREGDGQLAELSGQGC
eukprot:648821-Rhodomonas_salina.1